MRVMLDSNIIISAMVFRSSNMTAVLKRVSDYHELCISSYVLDEVTRILSEKFPVANADVATFFANYPYTLIDTTPDSAPLTQIRDASDYPILHAAIVGQVDILVTGDKDFLGVKVDRPEILAPLEFLARF